MMHRWRLAWRAARTAPLLFLAAACATTGGGRPPGPDPAPGPAPITLDRPPALVVEAIVTDRKGAPAQELRVTDFDVVVDGRQRAGVALGRLFRGPGADFSAASRGPGGPGEVLPLSEPSRVVVIVIDQASFSPGDEHAARAAVESWFGLLGLSDHVSVIALPARGTTTIGFERADGRKTLAALRPMWGRVVQTVDADVPQGPPAGGLVAPPAGAAGVEAPARADAARAEGQEREPDRPGAQVPERESIPPAVLKAHASATLGALKQIAGALTLVPGGKTILFVSSGLVATDLAAEMGAVGTEAARAHARIVALQVPSTSALHEIGGRDLHLLAQSAGGRLVALTGKPQPVLERLANELTFSYLLMLAPMPGDAGREPHAVSVALRRRGDLQVQAPALVLPGRIGLDDLTTALSPRAQAEVRAAAAPPPTDTGKLVPPGASLPGFNLFAHDRSVDLVLARVSQYAWDYGRELSSIVSEETYRQEVRGENSTVALNGMQVAATRVRTLVSDYLLVKVPGVEGWLPFRDVFEADGKPVRDREDRLVKLFLQSPSPEVALERANQVLRESARYNIGPVVRTLNVPTLPLWFLEPSNLRRFAFRKAGEEKIDGRNAVVLEFTEKVRPTFIKTSAGLDVPVLGRVWVDPLNGRILRTRISALAATITVKYAQRPEIPGLWLPESMNESYSAGRSEINATATYAKYRQFLVLTSEQVTVPKK